ncbi:MAG: nucleotidyltransferase domain-containing protein [Candidatus Sumerlaeota bacterium]|nr:nucleotidyltransferase domain-containing protein [Candidatus Sumerlaeota bacterium]
MVDEITLLKAAERLAFRFNPDKIILFGSQARGAATDRSDVDLLVVCNCEGRRHPLMAEMDLALAGMGFAKDIVVMTPKEFALDSQIPGTLARPAAMEGRVIYERS